MTLCHILSVVEKLGKYSGESKVLQCFGNLYALYLEDRGSIPGRVIPKTQKWYLIPPCLTLSIMRYRSRVKWSNPENGVTPSPTSWCCSYWKGSLRVTLDKGRQLYFFYMLYSSSCNKSSLVFKEEANVLHHLKSLFG